MKESDTIRASNIALLLDFDNMAISTEQFHSSKFDVAAVIDALRDRGRIIIKRAYADWKKWAGYQNTLMNNAVEMVHLPYHKGSNKNNADIKMAVDAVEYVYSNQLIDTFVIVSGDSDFQSLVTKLRENGKYVITIGVRKATSDLLIFNSDEFISYESIMGLISKGDAKEAYELLVDVMRSTVDKNLLSLSNIKNLLLRKNPSFNEKEYGFSQFKDFIISAEDRGYILTEKGRGGRELFLELSKESSQPKKSSTNRRRRSPKK